jgi:phytoene synthase
MADLPVRDVETALSLAYAPASARPALTALWRLDETLAAIVQSTTEPMIGQMRLTWWQDALLALADAPPPAEPVLSDIAHVIPHLGGAPERLVPLIDGWEVLLDPLPWDDAQLASYAQGRGETLFTCAATLLVGDRAGVAAAGRGWALVDLAFRCSDRSMARRAIALADRALADAPRHWPGRLRSLGMLSVLAARDVRAGLDRPRRPGSPARVLRALRHRITGG